MIRISSMCTKSEYNMEEVDNEMDKESGVENNIGTNKDNDVEK